MMSSLYESLNSLMNLREVKLMLDFFKDDSHLYSDLKLEIGGWDGISALSLVDRVHRLNVSELVVISDYISKKSTIAFRSLYKTGLELFYQRLDKFFHETFLDKCPLIE